MICPLLFTCGMQRKYNATGMCNTIKRIGCCRLTLRCRRFKTPNEMPKTFKSNEYFFAGIGLQY